MQATNTFTATGRRKEAVSSVQMEANGNGQLTVNGRDFDDYFTTISQRMIALRPLLLTDNHKAVNVRIRANGGGANGQAGAASLAIARALIKWNPELRPLLKSKGLLRRDSRQKERKKPGRPGARKRFQYSKR